MTSFQQWLAARKACPQARNWVGEKSVTEAWKEASRGDWMQWFLGQLNLVPPCTCGDIPQNDCPWYVFNRMSPDQLREKVSETQVFEAYLVNEGE